ncbi:MAG: porin family protein [Methylobacteriaceae bacterium]|nr:porin family protein [Methylobacteriaceae bacterium]
MRVAIKSALLALPVSTLALASAVAADLPTRKPAPTFVPAPPIFTWTGFYVGAQGGWAGGGSDKVGLITNVPAIGSNGNVGDLAGDGGFIGLRAGYDHQFAGSPLVLGVVGDINYNWIKESIGGAYLPATTYFGSSRVDWDGALRLKIGYAFDRFMVYGTGGVAFANQKYTLGTTTPLASLLDAKSTHVGWTLGAGVQYAITNNLVAGLDYRYAQFEAKRHTGAVFPAGVISTSAAPNYHKVAATLDWKF